MQGRTTRENRTLAAASDADLMAELKRRADERNAHTVAKEASEYAAKMSPIGRWLVTGHDGEDGKTAIDFGVYEGHVADIAAELAPQAYFGLDFKIAPANRVACGMAATVVARIHPPEVDGFDLARSPDETRAAFVMAWLRSAPSKTYDATTATGNHYAGAVVTLNRKTAKAYCACGAPSCDLCHP